jgi:hypothetical protein
MAPTEVGHEDLVVLLLGEGHREALTEEAEAGGRHVEELVGVAVEVGLERPAGVEAEVVATPLMPSLDEGAGVDDRYVRRERRRLRERPPARVGPLATTSRAGEFDTTVHEGRRGDGEGKGRLEVRLVEAREDPTRLVGLEARPDVDQPVGGVDGAVHTGSLAGAGSARRRRRPRWSPRGRSAAAGRHRRRRRRSVDR